jgi:hypothetical protein
MIEVRPAGATPREARARPATNAPAGRRTSPPARLPQRPPPPRALTAAALQSLQRSAGNRAVSAVLARALATPTAAPAPAPAGTTPGRAAPPADLASAPVEEVLAAPPARPDRTPAAKQRDLDAATTLLTRIVRQSASLAEAQPYFPLVTRRFGLTGLHVVRLGTPAAAIELRINPAAGLLLSAAGRWMLNNVGLPAGALPHKAKFLTQQINGVEVGTEMRARRLGPNHPQGGPPQTTALAAVMALLPVHPALPADQKYIKGHLLNDNLGGPGRAANLFPITAQANKDHEQWVETLVKQWVNQQGFWVKYVVQIVVVGHDLLNAVRANRFIDADIVCTVAKLDATGAETDGFTRTIQSRYRQRPAVGPSVAAPGSPRGAAPAQAPGAPARDPNFNPAAVEWSTARGDPTQPHDLDPTLRLEATTLRSMLDELGADPLTRSQALGRFLGRSVDLHRNILMSADFDVDRVPGVTEPARVARWNLAVRQLNDAPGIVAAIVGFQQQLVPVRLDSRRGRLDPLRVGPRDARRRVLQEANAVATVTLPR